MSKRFGRNQRRRMRVQVAELEQRQGELEAAIRHWIEHSRRCREIVEDTAEVLGKHFITLNPRPVEIQRLDEILDGCQVDHKRMEAPDCMDGELTKAEAFMIEALPVLHGTVLARQLGQATHVRFKIGGHQAGYAVSENTLMMLPRDKALKLLNREISGQLAYHLYKSIGKPDPRGRYEQ